MNPVLKSDSGLPILLPSGKLGLSPNCCCQGTGGGGPGPSRCNLCMTDRDTLRVTFAGILVPLNICVVDVHVDGSAMYLVSGDPNGTFTITRDAAGFCSWSGVGSNFVIRAYDDAANPECTGQHIDWVCRSYITYAIVGADARTINFQVKYNLTYRFFGPTRDRECGKIFETPIIPRTRPVDCRNAVGGNKFAFWEPIFNYRAWFDPDPNTAFLDLDGFPLEGFLGKGGSATVHV